MANKTLSCGNTFLTWPRSQYIQGSAPVYWSEYKYLSGPRRPVMVTTVLLEPFSTTVWIFSFLVVVLVTLVMGTSHKVFKTKRTRSATFSEKFLNILAMAVEEPVNHFNYMSNSLGSKLILSTFLMLMLVLSKTYRGSILSKMVKVELEMKIDTTEVGTDDHFGSMMMILTTSS